MTDKSIAKQLIDAAKEWLGTEIIADANRCDETLEDREQAKQAFIQLAESVEAQHKLIKELDELWDMLERLPFGGKIEHFCTDFDNSCSQGWHVHIRHAEDYYCASTPAEALRKYWVSPKP